MHSKTLTFSLIFSFSFLSFTLSAKESKAPKKDTEKFCTKYKGSYINYVGTDIFFVTKDCQRKLIDKEELDKETRKGKKVLSVGADVIRALPKAAQTEKYTYKETYKKFEKKCIEASTIVYKIENKGKRPFLSLAQARKECPSITPVNFKLLAVLPDKRAMPLPKKLKKNQDKELAFIQPKELCKKMKIGKIYSYYSELFTLKKGKEACYLEEIATTSLKERMKADKNTPIELTSNEYLSLTKEKAPKKPAKGKKS